MTFQTYGLPFVSLPKAVPRLLLLSSLIICWLGGAFSAYADSGGNCNATYSVADGYGKFFLPCVESNDGKIYQAHLDHVQGAEQFLFELKITPLVNPPAGTYASFDQKMGAISIPLIKANLGGQQQFYTMHLVKQGQSDTGNLIFGFASLPKVLDAKNPIPAELASYTKAEKVPPGQAKKIAHEGAELEIGTGAVSEETTLRIKSLADAEIPPLPVGMINVTKGQRKGFRLSPHGMKFKKKIKLKLPYDKKHLPAGYSEQDINTYYYDDLAKQWQIVERVAVDTDKQEVTSLIDHFSDWINAVNPCNLGSNHPAQYLCYGDWEKYSSQGNVVENTDFTYHFPLEGGAIVEHTLVMYQYAKQENSSIGHYLGIDSSYAGKVEVIATPTFYPSYEGYVEAVIKYTAPMELGIHDIPLLSLIHI